VLCAASFSQKFYHPLPADCGPECDFHPNCVSNKNKTEPNCGPTKIHKQPNCGPPKIWEQSNCGLQKTKMEPYCGVGKTSNYIHLCESHER